MDYQRTCVQKQKHLTNIYFNQNLRQLYIMAPITTVRSLYVKQSMCKNGIFSPSCFRDGHEAESTFGMVTKRFAPWRLYKSADCAIVMNTVRRLSDQDIYWRPPV